MWRGLIFVLAFDAWAGTVQVEIRDSQVFLNRDGQSKQLTHDAKLKGNAVISPDGGRVAYWEQCALDHPCAPSIAVIDLSGQPVRSFEPMMGAVPPGSGCVSILALAWAGNGAIGVECHINPSLSEYVETDIGTGKILRDLLGFDFVRAPDGSAVAHVGWIIHFAPPYAQSYYLQVDHTTIYPLPQGMKPVEQVGLTEAPKVVVKKGPTYSGIHEFQPGLSWSPDSKRIALVDCTYDWTPRHPAALSGGDGEESGRRCFVVAASRDGKAVVFPLPAMERSGLNDATVSWTGPGEISFTSEALTKSFKVGTG